jgi:hypothetical protein
MTAESDEQLEHALTELTAWRGPAPQLWRRALQAAKAGRARTSSRLARMLHQLLSAPIAAAIVVVALGVTIAINLPHLGRSRSMAGQRRFPVETTVEDGVAMDFAGQAIGESRVGITHAPVRGRGERGAAIAGDEAVVLRSPVAPRGERLAGSFALQEPTVDQDAGATIGTGGDEASAAERYIVRKATLELLTDDVRAAFLKAALILNEADGEYIQDSSLTGSGENTQANLTLRVAAHRLPEVMNQLRELGEVRSEQVTGQDVTTQVVDLEARLRNEQRVETELLELLEKRSDAPLKEILELRSTLSQVRGEIERLTAQREHLGRLVSLATMLVIIRTDKTTAKSTDFSIGHYFVEGVQRAWQKGLILLADTCGFLLSVLVGGLIWWVLLVLAFAAIWRYRRRRLAVGSTTRS